MVATDGSDGDVAQKIRGVTGALSPADRLLCFLCHRASRIWLGACMQLTSMGFTHSMPHSLCLNRRAGCVGCAGLRGRRDDARHVSGDAARRQRHRLRGPVRADAGAEHP